MTVEELLFDLERLTPEQKQLPIIGVDYGEPSDITEVTVENTCIRLEMD